MTLVIPWRQFANFGRLDNALAMPSGATVTRSVTDWAGQMLCPEDFGAVGDGTTDDTDAMQAFFTALVGGVRGFIPGNTYLVSETIAPAGQFHVDCLPGAEIKFSTAGTYTDILNADGADTGVDVAFDVKNCEGSVIHGELRLLSSGSLSNLPTTLAGFTASGSDNSNMTIEALTLAFFGYGLYQPPASASGNYTIYTRSSFRFCNIEFCNVPIEMAGANGLDEVWFDTIMIRRCRDRANIVQTQFVGGALYISGFTNADREPSSHTGSITASSTTLTLTTAGDWANGDRIIVEGAGQTSSVGLATVVSSGAGTTTLTLRDAAGTTVSGARLHRNPPISGFLINTASSLMFQRILLEHQHYVPIRLTGRPSLFSCASLEIATNTSAVYGCPIWHASTKGVIDINCIDPGSSSHLVFLAMLQRTSDSNRANRSVMVRTGQSLAEQGNNVVRLGQAPSDLYATGTFTDVSSSYTEDAVFVHAGGLYRVPNIAGAAPKPIGFSRDDSLSKTGDYTINRTETATHFDNTGASGAITFSLPASRKGDRYTFTRTANQTLRVDPNGSETIGSGGAGKYMQLDNQHDSVTIECVSDGTFRVVAVGLNAPSFEP